MGKPRILFVHGMTPRGAKKKTKDDLCATWYENMCQSKSLAEAWGKPPKKVISRGDVDMVYWADLVRKADEVPHEPTKGFGESVEAWYADLVRDAVLKVDQVTDFDAQAQPKNFWARRVRRYVYQTAMYMNDAPARDPDPNAASGTREQVQYRFRQVFDDEVRVVIGHSLGTVIAYEGLCAAQVNKVHTFLTLGSPIGTPRLIYGKLRPNAIPARWPNVGRWVNVCNEADVMAVPQPSIKDLFSGEIEEHLIRFGTPFKPMAAHRLSQYLGDVHVGQALAAALQP